MARTLTIGRDVNSRPMSNDKWSAFKDEVHSVLKAHSGVQLYFYGEGRGWSEEWGYEDAFTWVFDLADWAYPQDLTSAIVDVREKYEQQAVAYTVGNTYMV